MNVSDLETFIMVIASGGISPVARQLAVPKSTVSRRLKRLEESIGQPLVSRGPNRLVPTTQGLLLYERCEGAFSTIRQAEQEVSGFAEHPTGRLRVTMASVFGFAAPFSELMMHFLEHHPQVTLDVVASDDVYDLLELNFDVAVRTNSDAGRELDDRVSMRPLGTLYPSLYASETYLLRHGPIESVTQVAAHLKVVGPMFRDGVMLEGPGGERHRVEVAPLMVTTSLSHLIEAVLRGRTIAVLPPVATLDLCAQRQLVPVLNGWRAEGARIEAVSPNSSFSMAKTKSFIEFLETHAQSVGIEKPVS